MVRRRALGARRGASQVHATCRAATATGPFAQCVRHCTYEPHRSGGRDPGSLNVANEIKAAMATTQSFLTLLDWRRGWAARGRLAVVVVVVAGALAIYAKSRTADTPEQLTDASSQA